MATTRYGEDSHEVMVAADGTVQVSNPSPLPIIPASAGAGGGSASPVAACDGARCAEAPELLDGVPDAAGVPVTVAPARIARMRASFTPYVAVTSTPGPGASTWITWPVASAAAAAAGSAACAGSAAVPLGSTTTDDGTPAGRRPG